MKTVTKIIAFVSLLPFIYPLVIASQPPRTNDVPHSWLVGIACVPAVAGCAAIWALYGLMVVFQLTEDSKKHSTTKTLDNTQSLTQDQSPPEISTDEVLAKYLNKN